MTHTYNEITPQRAASFLATAECALRQVRPLITKHFRAGLAAELKSDRSPVTAADREAELILREVICKQFPEHGFVGEEHGRVNQEAEFQWIVDPIDGTQSFMHGIPTFGTMIALEFRGESIVGVIDHPVLGLCYTAAKGCGARCNTERLQMKDVPLAEDAWLDSTEVVCVNTRAAFAQNGSEARWDEFVKRTNFFRIYYDCFGLSQGVSGSASAMIEMNVHCWDVAAVPVLVSEAGGICLELPRWVDSQGYERRSVVFGKPTPARRLHEFMVSGR